MRKILIKNGRIWTGESFFESDVLVVGEKVEKIAKNIINENDFCYDAKGNIVSAGLVDIHTHLQGISVEAFGIQAEMATFPFGVTAANEASAEFGDKVLLDAHLLKTTVFVMSEITDNEPNLQILDTI